MPRSPASSVAVAVFSALLAAGCASSVVQRDATGNPAMARLSPEELARATPPARPRLGIEDVVRLSRTTPPEELIKLWDQSGSRLKLTEAQIQDMRTRGVQPRVIDHIVAADAAASRTERITAEVDRDAATRRRIEQAPYTTYPGYGPYYAPHVYPYGGYRTSPWGSGWSAGVGVGF